MVQAWFMNDSNDDQRLEHHKNPPEYVSLENLKEGTGVLYQKIDSKKYEDELELLRKKRGYTYSDIIEISPEKLPKYEEKIKTFFTEHLHTDEEIRFILGGSGYFDMRDKNDQWIRVLVEEGDLLIVPSGIYHRFTLDTKNYIKAMRLFVGEPVWTPHNRPAEDMQVRKDYVNWQKKGFPGIQ